MLSVDHDSPRQTSSQPLATIRRTDAGPAPDSHPERVYLLPGIRGGFQCLDHPVDELCQEYVRADISDTSRCASVRDLIEAFTRLNEYGFIRAEGMGDQRQVHWLVGVAEEAIANLTRKPPPTEPHTKEESQHV